MPDDGARVVSASRLSLAIALLFLGASIAGGDSFRDSRFAEVIRESFLIGGWVAMWLKCDARPHRVQRDYVN